MPKPSPIEIDLSVYRDYFVACSNQASIAVPPSIMVDLIDAVVSLMHTVERLEDELHVQGLQNTEI